MGTFLLGSAFVTQRAGLPLQGALCLFVALLPFAWLASLVVGGTVFVRTQRGTPRVERLALEFDEQGLTVRWPTRQHLAPWSTVKMNRDRSRLVVLLVPQQVGERAETFVVPERAFDTPQAFDEFCLELQKAVWAAERR